MLCSSCYSAIFCKFLFKIEAFPPHFTLSFSSFIVLIPENPCRARFQTNTTKQSREIRLCPIKLIIYLAVLLSYVGKDKSIFLFSAKFWINRLQFFFAFFVCALCIMHRDIFVLDRQTQRISLTQWYKICVQFSFLSEVSIFQCAKKRKTETLRFFLK